MPITGNRLNAIHNKNDSHKQTKSNLTTHPSTNAHNTHNTHNVHEDPKVIQCSVCRRFSMGEAEPGTGANTIDRLCGRCGNKLVYVSWGKLFS